MSLLNLPVIHEEKEGPHHPSEKTVKDSNFNKIKYAHNSIHNPPYPKKKEKERAPEKDGVKFTVIGNRVTKEFIYCAKMVQGMQKYRSKIHDPPVIKGVTSVEWPLVLNNLKIEYGCLAYCLSSQVAVLLNGKFLGGEKELRDLIESQYIYHPTINFCKESVNQFVNFVKESGLYTDIAPKTCENFLRLCKKRKVGYSGTPVHRIVKDGWIQCGGFGLKSVKMDCENFIVPHDRRGVLAMANDGRHVDCSTQFFVLLQPAPWMQSKYVAFGQLVDGEYTLRAMENVPTYYESPMAEIIIHKTGILNIDCQDITINPGAKAYIDGHIDDLVSIGKVFYETLMEQVFLEIEFRRIARMDQKSEEVEEEQKDSTDVKHKKDIHATQRFMRRKDEIHSQLCKMQSENKQASATHSKASSERSNKEFDVGVCEYEPEEYTYPLSSAASVSEPTKEKKPFYIPLTDVPYPDEVSSEYDLKKFLKGDYCLESDLGPVDTSAKEIFAHRIWSYASDIFSYFNEEDDAFSQRMDDLASDDEEEIKKYLKDNVDRVSFAGAVIKEVAKGIGTVNLFEKKRKSELISDEILRRFRVASMDRQAHEKKVSISVPTCDKGPHSKIKRRQTGFVTPEDLAIIRKISMALPESNDEEKEETNQPSSQWRHRKVSVSLKVPEETSEKHTIIKHRQTGFVGSQDSAKICLFNRGSIDDEDNEDEEVSNKNNRRVSVLINLPEKLDKQSHIKRRQPGFSRPSNLDELLKMDDDEDDEYAYDDGNTRKVRIGCGSQVRNLRSSVQESDIEIRRSVLTRLYEEVTTNDDAAPTLKDYRPMSESQQQKNILLTISQNQLSAKPENYKYYRPSAAVEHSFEHVLNVQHAKKVTREISSDYVNTIDQIERKPEPSIRSVEYAKTRPAMTVAEYQRKNRLHQEKRNLSDSSESSDVRHRGIGIRLPGDTPLFSQSPIASSHH